MSKRQTAVILISLLVATLIFVYLGLKDEAEGAGMDCSTITKPQGVEVWDVPDCYNIVVHPATNTEYGYWKLISGQFQDETQSGGNHNIYLRAIDINGNHPEPIPWHVVNGGDVRGLTKYPPEWADFSMFASYAPFEGQCGGYSAYMSDERARSDVVSCMALPYNHHVNWFLIWQYQPPQTPPAFSVYLPLVLKP